MASRTASSLLRQLRPSALRQPCRLLRPQPAIAARPPPALLFRAAHTIPRPPLPSEHAAAAEPSTSSTPAWQPEDAPATEGARPEPKNPAYYQLSFTCVPCGHRSHHNVSKQGYHAGSVLITCPDCRNRHVISDHLNIFGDRKVTVEDLMREKGRLVKRGSLGEDGDIEFWPDEEQAADTKTGSS
ncbi:DNL zinc finger domain containing protein [Cordyceps fumosorosea ARSEF 2679]|uniref:DNL zinc finger domain containing protein n=1 Tax=Cordyceps fumosorosea (strain ARSEF 2679) TaxID=1081104 RepID=A0A168CJH1_CORFA|nr:DNL zinc finger domain containing protein [Cordyceps fumosorosea ARSEF 2679]OAA71453.1 DNL zinc finger domain containing protein [Cordyceps fumosorosea ARSEF 2679]